MNRHWDKIVTSGPKAQSEGCIQTQTWKASSTRMNL